MRDFDGRWGDRRQEIVLIGQQMRQGGEQRLRKALDACLLDDEEFRLWEEAMGSESVVERLEELFEDGFEDWLDDHHGQDQEAGHNHPHPHPHHEPLVEPPREGYIIPCRLSLKMVRKQGLIEDFRTFSHLRSYEIVIKLKNPSKR
jgi:hypothetical protein